MIRVVLALELLQTTAALAIAAVVFVAVRRVRSTVEGARGGNSE